MNFNFQWSTCYLVAKWGAPLVAQIVKNLPMMQETQVWSLGQEYPLQKEMATHSGILAWRIPWTEEPGGLYSPWGRKKSNTTEQLTLSLSWLNDSWVKILESFIKIKFYLIKFLIKRNLVPKALGSSSWAKIRLGSYPHGAFSQDTHQEK